MQHHQARNKVFYTKRAFWEKPNLSNFLMESLLIVRASLPSQNTGYKFNLFFGWIIVIIKTSNREFLRSERFRTICPLTNALKSLCFHFRFRLTHVSSLSQDISIPSLLRSRLLLAPLRCCFSGACELGIQTQTESVRIRNSTQVTHLLLFPSSLPLTGLVPCKGDPSRGCVPHN